MQKGKVPPQAIQLAVEAVRTLDDDEATDDERLQAAETLMELATDIHNKAAVREAGGVQCLLDLLEESPEAPITNVAAEALACLAVGDAASRVRQLLSGWNRPKLTDVLPYPMGTLGGPKY